MPYLSHSDDHSASDAEVILLSGENGKHIPISISHHQIGPVGKPFFLAYLAKAENDHVNHQILESERLAAITEMASGLAHESRNALQRAVACLDLLELDLKDNPEHMVLSQRIRQSLADLLENYDEVRRYAEPMSISPKRIDLMRTCQTVFGEIAAERPEYPHWLGVSSIQEYDEVAYADGEKMKLVFRHLLQNAIDAAGNRAARIEINFEQRQGGKTIVMTQEFRDHGCGFDDHALSRAFEPFFTTKQHGTGLGLAICRRIIEAHHGKIDAANHPDGGSVITIKLPIDANKA
jgi:signal transduction histidine kinase